MYLLPLHQIASVQLMLRDPGAVFQPCVSIIGNGWGNSVSISGFASCLLCCSLKADAALVYMWPEHTSNAQTHMAQTHMWLECTSGLNMHLS